MHSFLCLSVPLSFRLLYPQLPLLPLPHPHFFHARAPGVRAVDCLSLVNGRLTLNGGSISLSVPTALAPNQWTHVAMVFDMTNRKAAIFTNGDQEMVDGLSPFFGAAAVLLGGTQAVNEQQYFSGEMDEVQFFSRALAVHEVQEALLTGEATHAPVAEFLFDDNIYPTTGALFPVANGDAKPEIRPEAVEGGGSAYFNGVATCIRLGSLAAMSPFSAANPFTVSMWIRPDGIQSTSGRQPLFTTSDMHTYLDISFVSTNTGSVLEASLAAVSNRLSSEATVSYAAWTHVAVVLRQ